MKRLPSWKQLKQERKILEEQARQEVAKSKEPITKRRILEEMTPEEVQLVAALPVDMNKLMDKLGIPD